MSEDKKADAVRKGHEAKKLLEHPVMIEAMQAIENDLILTWKRTESAQKREECWGMLDLMAKLHAKLQSFVANGRFAQKELDYLNDPNIQRTDSKS